MAVVAFLLFAFLPTYIYTPFSWIFNSIPAHESELAKEWSRIISSVGNKPKSDEDQKRIAKQEAAQESAEDSAFDAEFNEAAKLYPDAITPGTKLYRVLDDEIKAREAPSHPHHGERINPLEFVAAHAARLGIAPVKRSSGLKPEWHPPMLK